MKIINHLQFLKNKKFVSLLILFHILLYLGGAWWFSKVPEFKTIHKTNLNDKSIYFVQTLKELLSDELNHGWLPNDFIFSPTKLILDNRPNFQIGILTIVRHSVRVLRDNLSRQRTTDDINPDINMAFAYLNNDYEKWILPSFESRIKKTVNHLETFIKNFKDASPQTNYYIRSDNLIQLFEQYISELGSLNNKLLSDNIGFLSSDDLFYLVKGTNYALYSILHALLKDFHSVLEEKKCIPLMTETIARIKQSDFDPIIIVSGNHESLLANHLSQLAGITSDVRQKLKSLNVMLDKN